MTGTFKRQCGEVICSITPLLRITAGFHWTRSKDDATHTWVVDLNNGGRQSMAVVNPFYIRALCSDGPKED